MSETEMMRPDSQGKVRDIYDLGDKLLIVASDRISAFDYILPSEIPFKGEVLTRISKFWFEKFADLVPNHMLSTSVADLPEQFAEPIFTPSTKAAIGDHDENISYEQLVEREGAEIASQLRDLSIKIYSAAAEYAATRGIIIADTKFEFGIIDGQITLIDECITPDSSRFWPAEGYKEGEVQDSFDKQYVRNWLKANWDFTGEPPALPAEVLEVSSKKYCEAYTMLTGTEFVSEGSR